MKLTFALCVFFALGANAVEARTARYGGVAAEYCNKTGCHVNDHYAGQFKRQQEKSIKLLQQ